MTSTSTSWHCSDGTAFFDFSRLQIEARLLLLRHPLAGDRKRATSSALGAGRVRGTGQRRGRRLLKLAVDRELHATDR
jgi:hypothetical protein